MRSLVIVGCVAVIGAAVYFGVGNGPDTNPPSGCPDTAPKYVSGQVIGKQDDETKPNIKASNGDECWHMIISNLTISNNPISVYVNKRAYDAVKVGDSFRREQVRTTK